MGQAVPAGVKVGGRGRLRRTAGIAPPPLEEYFATLLDFARRARWGKVPIARAAA